MDGLRAAAAALALLVLVLNLEAFAAGSKPASPTKGPVVREASLDFPDQGRRTGMPGKGSASFLNQAIPGEPVRPRTVAVARDWTALFSDDFESGFPGSDWSLQDSGTGPYWGTWTCWANSGTRSVGCAAAGPGSISCGQNYLNDLEVWMTAGPGSLADPGITAGVLECYLKLNSEADYDYFYLLVSINGSNYYGFQYSGVIDQVVSLDLANVPTLGNILGQPQVWLGCVFFSDSSITLANGAQVDDVLLAVNMPAANQPPVVSLTAPNGGESFSAGSVHQITYTANDPDGGPSALALAFDYSTNGGGNWTPIVSGQPNSGSYNWTVPNISSSTARVRVRASDGAAETADSSDANFSIIQNQPPVVTLNAPNGGETLSAGATTVITYSASDPDSGPSALTLAFDYSTNGGGNWTAIASGQANSGSYTWTVPDVTTTTARVRARVTDGAAEATDTSNGNFTIVQNTNALALGDATGPSGTSVSVTLALENEDLVKGIQADITFDGTKASFAGIAAAGRAAGMTVDAEQVSPGKARIIMFFETENHLTAGSGDVANLTFTLQGAAGGTTNLTPGEMILSGTSGHGLAVTGTGGTLTVTAPQAVPALQLAVLKNPGRPRTLQILVSVAYGSGTAPTVSAGGATVTMSLVGPSVYGGTFSAAESAASVMITASDTNVQGTGNAQTTLSFQ